MFFCSPRLALLSKCRFHQCYSLKVIILENNKQTFLTNQIGTFWRPLLPLCNIIKFLPSTQVYLNPQNQSSYSLPTAFVSAQ